MINLFQHQQQALDETEGKNRVAYYLDMGLGKTFVGSEKMMKLNKRINLVVCQCSKVQDWIEHFQDHYTRNCVFDLTNPKTFNGSLNRFSMKFQPDDWRDQLRTDFQAECAENPDRLHADVG